MPNPLIDLEDCRVGTFNDAAIFDKLSALDDIFDGTAVVNIATATIRSLTLQANTVNTIGPELDFVGYNGRWAQGIDVANAPGSRDLVVVARRGTYSFEDGATTSGLPTLTSAAQGGFSSVLVGKAITGPNIPAGTTILAVGGPTSLTLSANASATASSQRYTITDSSTYDELYVKHRGARGGAYGFGVTPPAGVGGAIFRVQVAGSDGEDEMGGVAIRVGPTQTGDPFRVHDSANGTLLAVEADGKITGPNGPKLKAGNTTDEVALQMYNNAETVSFGFQIVPGSNDARFRDLVNGTNVWIAETTGQGFRLMGTKLGFFGATTVTRSTLTGSRAGNAALASLLTALHNMGLIVDSTTA